jgi:hypothetical protein
MTTLIDQLAHRLGPAGIRTEAADLASYGVDRCRGPWPVDPIERR